MKIKKRTSKNCIAVKQFIEEITGYSYDELTKEGIYNIDKLKEAAELILKNLNRFFIIIGDFDSDGINSCAELGFMMKELGVNVRTRIPKREAEGYGFSLAIAKEIPDNSFVICIDNGIVAYDAIEEVKKRGCIVLVLDHHQQGDKLPNADLIIDPATLGEADYPGYCGAGLAYKLICHMFGEDSEIARKCLAYACIATVGDVVPITGDNRQIVKKGLEALKNGESGTTSLLTLCKMNGLNPTTTATDIGFNVVPLLNAPERMEDGGAVKALISIILDNGFDEYLSSLIVYNQKRKKLVETVMSGLDLEDLKSNDNFCNCLALDCIPGIAGIIAGRVSEYTKKPVVIFTKNGEDELKGSVRSPLADVNIIETLRNTGLLIQGGGHAKAAGISIKASDLSIFSTVLNDLLKDQVKEIDTEDILCYDFEVDGKNFISLARDIISNEPYGEGFPEPMVMVTDDIVSIRAMGKDNSHCKITCNGYNIVAFNQALPDVYSKVKAIGRVTQNYYNGVTTIQLMAKYIEFA